MEKKKKEQKLPVKFSDWFSNMGRQNVTRGHFQRWDPKNIFRNINKESSNKRKGKKRKNTNHCIIITGEALSLEFSHVISFYPHRKNSRTENFTLSFLNKNSRKAELLCPGHTAIPFILLKDLWSIHYLVPTRRTEEA